MQRGRFPGCSWLGAGLLGSAAAAFLARSSIAALLGFLGGATLAVAVQQLIVWMHAQEAARLAEVSDLALLERALESRSPLVRTAAARRLHSLETPEAMTERLRGLARRSKGFGGYEVALELATALATHSGEGVRLLVPLLADETVTPAIREAVFEALADDPDPALGAATRESLERVTGLPTVELLWAFGLSGAPQDAVLAARFVACESFAIASAAMAALDELLGRGEPADRAPLADALRAAREKLRAVHPPGDNRLADELVAGLENHEPAPESPRPGGA